MTEMTREQMLAQIAALQAQNTVLAAKAATRQKVSFKVTDKGGMSMYGLGRFPVTLYKSQWQTLLANVKAIETFLADNDSKLATKD